MKSIIISALTIFLFIGCEEETVEQNETSIYGTWQLVEAWVVDGVDGKWVSVEEGYLYELKPSKAFESTRYEECKTGTFQIENDSLIFIYDCPQFNPCEKGNSRCVEKFEKKGDIIVMTPTYQNCAEGCGRKFKKVADKIRQTD